MVRTIITPENQDVSVHIPVGYIGRKIEILVYAVDELKEEEAIVKKKPSDFRGSLNLSDAQYNDFQTYLKEVRNEWDRDIWIQ